MGRQTKSRWTVLLAVGTVLREVAAWPGWSKKRGFDAPTYVHMEVYADNHADALAYAVAVWQQLNA